MLVLVVCLLVMISRSWNMGFTLCLGLLVCFFFVVVVILLLCLLLFCWFDFLGFYGGPNVCLYLLVMILKLEHGVHVMCLGLLVVVLD